MYWMLDKWAIPIKCFILFLANSMDSIHICERMITLMSEWMWKVPKYLNPKSLWRKMLFLSYPPPFIFGAANSHPHPSSVQSLSLVRLFATPWIAAHQDSLSISNSRSSLRLTSIESVMPSSHLILGRSLLFLPPIPPSIRVLPNNRSDWWEKGTFLNYW